MEKLVRRAQRGDRDAFVRLMEEHKLSMTRTALAVLHDEEDAADAIGETVLTAFAKLHTLREPKYFKTWLTRVLLCNCYGILRLRRGLAPLDQLPEGAAPEKDRDLALDVGEALSSLAENDRLVLTLHYLDDLPVKEIARMLGVKENTVKTRLLRGRERFKKAYLEREGKPCEAEKLDPREARALRRELDIAAVPLVIDNKLRQVYAELPEELPKARLWLRPLQRAVGVFAALAIVCGGLLGLNAANPPSPRASPAWAACSP